MNDKIAGLVITIDGSNAMYEAHSFQKVAEILRSQLETLEKMPDEYKGSRTIDSFEIAYFQNV